MMESLLKRKRILKGRFTRLEGVMGKRALEEECSEIELQKVEQLDHEVSMLLDEMGQLCDGKELDEYEKELGEMEVKLYEMKKVVVSKMRVTRDEVEKGRSELRLPKINLPTFSGQYGEWVTFHDLFVASIDKNVNLSNAQKLQYLKSALKGEAAVLIKTFSISDANYRGAWDMLVNRFHNHREIMNSHLDNLVKQPVLTSDQPEALRKLVDRTGEAVRSIKQQGAPIEYWDVILIYLISRKLDPLTLKEWELSLEKDEKPTYNVLMEFLEKRAHALAAAKNTSQVNVLVKPGRVSAHHSVSQVGCGQCKGTHTLSRCPEFMQKTIQERLEIVKKLKVCYNCLRLGHFSPKCQGRHCYKCSKYHHTLLHEEKDNQQGGVSQTQVTSHHSSEVVQIKKVLLRTARVIVRGYNGCECEARILIDSASQVSFMTEVLAQRLQVKRWKAFQTIHTLGGNSVRYSRGKTKVMVESIHEPNFNIEVDVLIMSQITSDQPGFHVELAQWEHCVGLQLADAEFGVPGPIDMLLGADVYGQLMKGGICKGGMGMPVAIQTHFGWILLGEVQGKESSSHICTYTVSTFDDTIIKQFWEVPEEVQVLNWTEEEHECERHYQQTVTRNKEGRFVLRLPFKLGEMNLGRSRERACQRFKYGESKWSRTGQIWAQYNSFMEEYIELNHMAKIDGSYMAEQTGYYLPHHAVMNAKSTTTKLRVVFDASAKSSTGVSLNDILMSGPKIQGDLIELLLRFQIPAVGLSADVAKMYRQILIHEEDRKYLKVLWRASPRDCISEYQLCTVTYGTACAPFQAIRSLQKVAEEGSETWPEAARVVKGDFYVDDLITGCNSIDEGKALVKDLRELLGSAGFDLRKWSCNKPEVLDQLDIKLRESEEVFNIGVKHEIMTLGIKWNPEKDKLSFICPEYTSGKRLTKRVMLSELARVFDPLGWLSPLTVQGKIIFQNLWKEELGWDDIVPVRYVEQWDQYKSDVQRLIKIEVPRCMIVENIEKYELHAFADASNQAYAAVVYLNIRSRDGKGGKRLLAARTRVAPIHLQTLPRLELCAAVLTSRLTKVVRNALQNYKPEVYAYSDSMIVLAWIRSNHSKWKPFVSHRVEEINRNLPGIRWTHVAGKDNPADHATRQKSVIDLEKDVLWWQGPETFDDWPDKNVMSLDDEVQVQCEEKKKLVLINVTCRWQLFENYSSMFKLIQVVAWIFRFKKNSQGEKENRTIGNLKGFEYQQALKKCILLVQKEYFYKELKQLEDGQLLKGNSHILSLHPFRDYEGILRVGGRIARCQLPHNIKFPILLPGTGHFINLLIREMHLKLLHGGPMLVLVTLRQKYWIINGRSAIRKVIHKCIKCHREQGVTLNQLMGELPEARVTPSRPFAHSGIDYAGPFFLHTMAKGRAKRVMKGYVVVFVCFATKAVHLELVSNLTTSSFMAALRRFCGRRGRPRAIYSDCGSNFKGADKELKRLYKEVEKINDSQEMTTYLAQENIQWNFNPPATPHFGGLWEAAVKSMKGHLRRVVGKTLLNYEEMETILVQIEACLNSRPLTSMSQDPNDLEALTPGHFLIGTSLYTIPDFKRAEEKVSLMSRWQHCQYIINQFWKRWSREYITQLQQRPKWKKVNPNVRVGQLVLIKEENLAPQLWKLGRIVDTRPGSDGLVRSVLVKTKDGIYNRPIVKLSVLPIDDEPKTLKINNLQGGRDV